uniref:VWFA domain-containing protein n=1 Tax=viral metagenome TaxID=1070528 RepID=A0A6C0CQJ7_9ZZZZ
MENYRLKNASDISSDEDNFEILKCNITGECQYEDVQWTLICDRSGSMYGDKFNCLLYTMVKMLEYFLEDSIKRNNTHIIHIIAFDNEIAELKIKINKETKLESFKEEIKKILTPKGMTDIGLALNTLNKTKYEENVSMHNVIFMSDGEVTVGVSNAEKLKEKLEIKLNNITAGTPAILGYGVQHDIDCMEKLSSVPNGEYHCIESTEGAGVVYGEVMHSCLNGYCRNTELILEGGQVYDFKSNIWVDKLSIGRLLFNKPITWTIKRDHIDKEVVAKLIGESITGEKKEILISMVSEPEKGEVNREVERYRLRYLTQKLLAETRQLIEEGRQSMWRGPPNAQPAISRLKRQNAGKLSLFKPDSDDENDILSPPPIKRQRAWPNNEDDGEVESSSSGSSSPERNMVIKTPKEKMIERLEDHMKMLKEYIETNGDDTGFVTVLCDDTYVAICSLRAHNGRHFIVARQVSQGNQRAYMASDMSDMQVEDFDNIISPHQMLRSHTTPYASQQVVKTIRAVSDNVL